MGSQISVPLDVLYKGGVTKISYECETSCSCGNGVRAGSSDCQDCKGSGIYHWPGMIREGPMTPKVGDPQLLCRRCGAIKCPLCNGSQYVQKTLSEDVLIEPGGHRGQRVEERSYLVNALPHSVFQLDGDDLIVKHTIPLLQALTGAGGNIKITHLDGHIVEIPLPVGRVIKPGDKVSVPNEGMPLWRKPGYGQLHVTFEVEFPDTPPLWITPNADLFQTIDPKLRDSRKIPDHVNVNELCDPYLSAEEFSRMISECDHLD